MNSAFPYGGTVSGVQFRAPEDDIKSLVIFSNLKSRSKECPTFGIMHETLDEEQKFGPPVLKKLWTPAVKGLTPFRKNFTLVKKHCK